jgi:hypothetical protein
MKHIGGTETKGGFYWKKGEWEIVTVDGKKGMLPGGSESQFIRLPGILVIPTALVLSITYVVFLPFIGFAMLLRALGSRVAPSLRGAGETKPEPAQVPAGRDRQ